MLEIIMNFLIIFFIVQIHLQISQIDTNGYNPFCDKKTLFSGTGMLIPRRVKCSFCEKAFATSAPVLWNALPCNVRNAKYVESFKSGLKT